MALSTSPRKSLLRIGALLLAVAIAAGLRLFGATKLPLSGDEAYHWEWSRHLAGAYYDHPGMTAWLIALGTALLQDAGELAVRLPALCCALATTAIAFFFARDLARARGADADAAERSGVIAASLVFFVPLPAAMSTYMSTDPPLMPFWLGTVWAMHRALQGGRTISWLLAGACLGLAAATKLIALQLLGVIGLFLLASARGRAWLRRPQPWLALLLALAAAAPMLLWNLGNDWMTFRFNFVIRQRERDSSIWHPLGLVAGQAAVLTPGFMVMALAACLRRGSRASLGGAAVVCTVLVPLAFFVLVSLKRSVGVHWTTSVWLSGLVLLAVEVGMREPWTARPWARLGWRSSWALTAVLLFSAHLFTLIPERIAAMEVAGGQPRRVLRNLFGWHEVGRATAAAVADLREPYPDGGAPREVFVMSNQYGTAAAIAFYTPGQPRVHLWSAARNHGRSYLGWDDWAGLRGQHAVYVSKHPLADWEGPFLRSFFTHVGEVERIEVAHDGELRKTFFLVRCQGFDGRRPFPLPD